MNEETAFAEFLNDIEQIATKYGWNIGAYENYSDNEEFESINLMFIPAIGYDSQFRIF